MDFQLSDCVVQSLSLADIRPYSRNPRLHSKRKLEMLKASIQRSRTLSPVLLDKDHTLVAGHARYLVAKELGLTHIPGIVLGHLSEADCIALRIADNSISEKGEWSMELLAKEIELLSSFEVRFEPLSLGFETPELDGILLAATNRNEPEADSEPLPALPEVAISRVGDIFHIGNVTVACGDSRDRALLDELLGDRKVAAVITDMPWNLKADFISNRGQKHFDDFVMGSGEMSADEFQTFMREAFEVQSSYVREGGLIFQFIDWRSVRLMIETGEAAFGNLVNICVWVKQNGRFGSPYRSQHELVCVFRKGTAKITDHVKLGKYGRNRTNVWTYQAPSGIGAERDKLRFHPTCKNVDMIADAILDCTDRGDLVLDAFLGSGTTALSAVRTGRAAIGIELDPRYVDVCIRRLEAETGDDARLKDGTTFTELAARRGREAGE